MEKQLKIQMKNSGCSSFVNYLAGFPMQRYYTIAFLFLVLLSASCASLPKNYVKVNSTAIRDTGGTLLGQRMQALAAAHPGESGFYVLSDGVEAMAARLQLTRHAQVSIDLQY